MMLRHAAIQNCRRIAAINHPVLKGSQMVSCCRISSTTSQFQIGRENSCFVGTAASRATPQDRELLSQASTCFPKRNITALYEGGYLVPTMVGLSEIISNDEQKLRARRFLIDLPAGCVVREQFYGSEELRTYNNTEEFEAGIKELGLEFMAHNCFSPPPEIVSEKISPHLQPNTVLLNVPADFSNHGKEGICQENVRNVYLSDRKLLVTTRPVKAGDELFNDYTDYGKIPWFENYLSLLGERSIRQFGHQFEDAQTAPPRSPECASQWMVLQTGSEFAPSASAVVS